MKSLSFVGIIIAMPAFVVLLFSVGTGICYINAIFESFIACLRIDNKAYIKITHLFICIMKVLLTIAVFVTEFCVYKTFTDSYMTYFIMLPVSVVLFFVFIELSNFEEKYAGTLMFSRHMQVFNEYERQKICIYLEELIRNKKQ